jgi:hypothetical protein
LTAVPANVTIAGPYIKRGHMGCRFNIRSSGITLWILVSALSNAQTNKKTHATASVYQVPHTPDGQPDLQGIWTNSTLTPLERPADLAGKAFFTEQEAEQYERRITTEPNANRSETTKNVLGRSYDEFWHDEKRIVPSHRTSLIVDPPDGRIPPLTLEGQKRADARAQERKLHGADGPESLSALERCIVASNAGPPMMPGSYNANYQIVQTSGYVLILSEQIHDTRVIPLDGRPHLSPSVHQWMGDSRGHWEGNTLIVETTNFRSDTKFEGASGQPSIPDTSEALRLVERFTRTAQDMILYEFTVNDPETFTKPWTVELPLHVTKGPLYEFACHEGNYGMMNMLSGARAEEKAAGGNK